MSDVIAAVAILIGTLLFVLSGVGIMRMPDVYVRLQVASKAPSLGVGLVMFAVAFHFGTVEAAVRAVLVVAFIFLTTPVSAQLIGRAAYLSGVAPARGSQIDELAGAYDHETGALVGRATGGADESAADEVSDGPD